MTSCTQSRVASVTNGANFKKKRKCNATPLCRPETCPSSTWMERVVPPGQNPRSQGFCDPCKRWGLPLNVERRVTQAAVAPIADARVGGQEGEEGLLQPRQMCEAMAAQILASSGQREAGEGSAACGSPFQLSVRLSDALCTVLSVPHAAALSSQGIVFSPPAAVGFHLVSCHRLLPGSWVLLRAHFGQCSAARMRRKQEEEEVLRPRVSPAPCL